MPDFPGALVSFGKLIGVLDTKWRGDVAVVR